MPGVLLRLGIYHTPPPLEALLYGLAILGAAFVLSWAADVAQLDMAQGLALAILALIAILPEYVVDATFAWKAAENPEAANLAVANMTGANRVLIGLAWPMVVLIYFFKTRERRVDLGRGNGTAIVALLVATAYAFVIPLKGTLSWVDPIVLGSLFALYVWRLSRMPAEEPDLVGPSRAIGELPARRRRLTAAVMGIVSAAVVLLVAEPFADALVATGKSLGISEFLLVQWAAPVASEAPEFAIAAIFAWRALANESLSTLLSSKVNQWTLLVGLLPVVYAISLGALDPMPLDGRQEAEILLTAAQSLFAIVLLLDMLLSVWGALVILVFFMAQFVSPNLREEVTVAYFVAAAVTLLLKRRRALEAFKDAANPPTKDKKG